MTGRGMWLAVVACLLPAMAGARELPQRGPDGRYHMVFGAPVAAAPSGQTIRYHTVYAAPATPVRQVTGDIFPSPAVPVPPVPAVVTITGGQLHGSQPGDGSFAFKGIPFAEPPVGRLRWAPPQDVVPWQGVREALQSAPACLQNDYGWQTAMAAASSEDCLYLDVRTPSLTPARPLPVIIFFHGGANRAGGAAGTVDAGFVTKGVVIVSFQYRLGVFGFLSHPALTTEGRGASGNYGLMDQIKALQWVQANIARFGGDPYNVTIVGHSAGAQDVGLLLASPLSRGLFNRAVEESGTPQFGFAPRTLRQNEAMGVALAAQFSRHAPNSAWALDDLRHVPASELQAVGDKLEAPLEDQSFIWDQAVVDGRVLPRAPEDIFRAGEAAKVPLIIGVSARELGLADVNADINAAEDRRFGASRHAIDTYYAGAPDPLYGDKATQLSTDIMLRCPAEWVASHMAGPVWLYQLDVDRDGTIHHGSELNFVMNPRPAGKDDGAWPPLLDYWTQFAKTGQPAGKGLAAWPEYGAGKRHIEFTPHGAVTGQAWRAPVCGLLDRP